MSYRLTVCLSLLLLLLNDALYDLVKHRLDLVSGHSCPAYSIDFVGRRAPSSADNDAGIAGLINYRLAHKLLSKPA